MIIRWTDAAVRDFTISAIILSNTEVLLRLAGLLCLSITASICSQTSPNMGEPVEDRTRAS
jgi:hypothetical protein